MEPVRVNWYTAADGLDGRDDGCRDGLNVVGSRVGESQPNTVGVMEGMEVVGSLVALVVVGRAVGMKEGTAVVVGVREPDGVGEYVGAREGEAEGVCEGFGVGS